MHFRWDKYWLMMVSLAMEMASLAANVISCCGRSGACLRTRRYEQPSAIMVQSSLDFISTPLAYQAVSAAGTGSVSSTQNSTLSPTAATLSSRAFDTSSCQPFGERNAKVVQFRLVTIYPVQSSFTMILTLLSERGRMVFIPSRCSYVINAVRLCTLSP